MLLSVVGVIGDVGVDLVVGVNVVTGVDVIVGVAVVISAAVVVGVDSGFVGAGLIVDVANLQRLNFFEAFH